MILVIADRFDVHADKVIEKIKESDGSVFRLNIDIESLQDTIVHYDFDGISIMQDNVCIHTEIVKTVWVRRSYVEIPFEMQDNSVSQRIWKGEWNKFISGIFYLLRSAKWMNDPRRAFPAENKYMQMNVARKLGFLVPNSIVSNDKQKISEFVENYISITKMMSQQLHKTDNGIMGIYANILGKDDVESFQISGENPIFVQSYVSKSYEVRYTVVGNVHLACRIDSQASDETRIDWRRYDLPRTPHSQIEVPLEIRARVDALMAELGLIYGALDFVVAPDGQWYFLEVNPMGQWLWIEDLTGLPISSAIANWLRGRIE